MTENTKRLPEGVTEEQLTQFMRQHGPDKVFPVRVRKNGVVHVGIFRKPTLIDMSAAASVGTSNPVAAGELLYSTCKLAVDNAMDNDDEVKLAAINGVSKLFKVLETEVGEPFGAEA